MAWKALDRITPKHDPSAAPLLGEAAREKIRSFLPRYETRRAALLPALHVAQETLGWINHQAMIEIAQVLEIPPSQVLDTISFYTHYWTHRRGRKVIMVCRSISCQLLGSENLLAALQDHLGIAEHETTPDGEYSLVTEECLAACDHGPCMLVGERLHKCVRPQDVPRLLADPDNDRLAAPRSDLYDGVAQPPPATSPAEPTATGGAARS